MNSLIFLANPIKNMASQTVFSTNFNNGAPSQFSGFVPTESVRGYNGIGTGTNFFSGNFLRNISGDHVIPQIKTTLTLTGLPTHTSIDLNFLLAVIGSWDGNYWYPAPSEAPDLFNVTVDGNPLFTEAIDNFDTFDYYAPNPPGDQTYIPPTGVFLGVGNYGFNNLYSDSAYNLGLDPTFDNIPHTASTLTVQWFASGLGWQGDTDESWGIDNVEVILNNASIQGDDNNNLLNGTGNNDNILGLGGNDTLNGLAGNDTLNGGTGNDFAYGSDGNDSLNGEFGNDYLDGGNKNDYVNGDDLSGSQTGNDTVYGNNGNDTVYGGQGKDYVDGGAGNDLVDGWNGYGTGFDGNDTVLGGDGDDSVYGGQGNDFLDGGTGNDSLLGGEGIDKLYGNLGNDTLTGGIGEWKDTVDGGDGNDYLLGGDGNDYLVAGQGNDTADGGKGKDIVFGNTGNDFLTGANGNDSLDGGTGNDTLNGYGPGTDKDTLTGGANSDLFVLGTSGSVFYSGATSYGIITDLANGDKIQLKNSFSNYNLIKNQNLVGTSAKDSLITTISGDIVGVIQDNTSLITSMASSIFVYV